MRVHDYVSIGPGVGLASNVKGDAMKLLVLLSISLLTTYAAHAAEITDFQCVRDCQAKGYMYMLCYRQCTVVEPPQDQRFQSTADCNWECWKSGKSVEKCRKLCE